MSSNSQSQNPEQIEAMARYSITYEDGRYKCGQYWYEELQDAINFAKAEEDRKNPTSDNKTHSESAIHYAITSFHNKYGSAKAISFFISFLGWAGFVGGIIAAIIGINKGNRYDQMPYMVILLPGIITAISGLFLVATGQVVRALVDNANHTREILHIIKNRLER